MNHQLPAIRRARLSFLLTLTCLAGCSGWDPSETVTDADLATDKARVEYINSWQELEIPETAAEVRFYLLHWLDLRLHARFVLPKADLEAFVEQLDGMTDEQGVVYKGPRTNEYQTLYRKGRMRVRREPGLCDASLLEGGISYGDWLPVAAIEQIEDELAQSTQRFGVEYCYTHGNRETYVTIADDSDGTVWLYTHNVPPNAQNTSPKDNSGWIDMTEAPNDLEPSESASEDVISGSDADRN